jgi:orotidine-5'-phosphate decarboxylase
MTFGSRLSDALADRGRFCAGIDPHPGLLDQWGLTDSVNGLEKFALTAVESFANVVPVIKPQSAFFERFGSRGVAVLEQVVEGAHELGCLVLLDVKRGDIGSTAQAYADAYLDKNSPLYVDAVTVSPYLGIGSVDPLVDTALANDAGVFLLALTSNPEGPQVQHAITTDGRSVAGVVLDAVASRNAGVEGLGSVGAVVGATVELPADVGIANLDVGGPLLVPGIGAQGGTLDDVRRVFGAAARNVLPTSSREILAAGPAKAALHDAALQALDTFSALA